ncbi:hypothetical protein ACJJTC_019426 [Scirpophaga incertulas]
MEIISDSQNESPRKEKPETRTSYEIEEELQTHLILKAPEDRATISPITFNIDVAVEEVDAELEAAVANLNVYKTSEETESETCVAYTDSQIVYNSQYSEIQTDNDLEDNSGPVVFNHSITGESQEQKTSKNKKKSVIDDDEAISIPEDSVILNEKKVYKKLDELAQQQLSTTDKILLVETRNTWGRVLFKLPQRNQHDSKIKYCLENVWKQWQSTTRLRDYPLFYKCYMCDKAWWHLYPFADHINNHHHVSIKLKLECKGHECSIIAFKDEKPPIRDIPLENECWRCGNDFKYHQNEIQFDHAVYTCSYCASSFYTCFQHKEHLPGCMQYRKNLRKNTDACLQFYKCHLCQIILTSKEDSFKHYSFYHDVRSDLPIATQNKFCPFCDQIYCIKLLHICPNGNFNHSCQYCSRRFPSKVMVQLHTSMTQQDFPCRICSMVLDSQCMEIKHLVESHSEKFVLVPKCLKCDSNVLLLNEDCIWQHSLIKHNQKLRRQRHVEMVLVPKDCLSLTELELLKVPKKETDVVTQQPPLHDLVDNDINIIITKTESLVEDGVEIIDIADPSELLDDELQNEQSHTDLEQIQEAVIKYEGETDDEIIIIYDNTKIKCVDELRNTLIPIEKECKSSDKSKIDSSSNNEVNEESSNAVVKIKEEPPDIGVVIKTEPVYTTPDDISDTSRETNSKERTDESAKIKLPAPKQFKIKYEDDIDFVEDIIVLKQENDSNVTHREDSENSSDNSLLRKVFGINKDAMVTNTELANVKVEVDTEDDISVVEPQLVEIEILSEDESEHINVELEEILNEHTELNNTDSNFTLMDTNMQAETDVASLMNPIEAQNYTYMKKNVKKSVKYKILKLFAKVDYFTCTKCVIQFDTYEKYMLHLPKHGIEEDLCPICGKKSRTLNHSDCYLCSAYGGFKKNKKNSEDLSLECKICKEYVDVRNRFSHWESHVVHLLEAPVSVLAGSIQDSIKRLGKHSIDYIRRTLKMKKLKNRTCALCLKVLARQGELKRHLIEHLLKDALARYEDHNGLRCHECPKVFEKAGLFRQHMREHACMPMYRCEICSKCFSDSSNSAKHKKVHKSQLPECDICGKKYHHLHTLARHIQTHETIGVIHCKHCEKKFYSQAALNKHMRLIADKIGYRFPCAICKAKFRSVRIKWDHMWQVHKQRKEIADCPICGESFRKYTDVRQHVITTHPGKLPMTLLKQMRVSRDYYLARKDLSPSTSVSPAPIDQDIFTKIKMEYESDS